jgi:hypothetical protein
MRDASQTSSEYAGIGPVEPAPLSNEEDEEYAHHHQSPEASALRELKVSGIE